MSKIRSKKMDDMIYKYFKDERQFYFLSSDALQLDTGETYLRFDYYSGNRIKLWFGSHNYGEFPIKICTTPEELEKIIQAIIN